MLASLEFGFFFVLCFVLTRQNILDTFSLTFGHIFN